MGFLNNWFGAGNAPKPKGESEFNLYGKQSRESFKSAAKKLSYEDRKKALALDKELRGNRTSSISHDKYLKAALKEHGSKFKNRLKEQIFTHYKESSGLSNTQKRMNIYNIKKQREEDAEKKEPAKFATQIDTSKVSPTAQRPGATSGEVVQEPGQDNIDRPVLKV
ncbi:MAG: hypothetical protein ABIG10_03730 [bacterium]